MAFLTIYKGRWPCPTAIGVTLVDEIDSDLAAHRWFLNTEGYVYRRAREKPRKRVWLHRVIMDRKLGHSDYTEIPDHRNRNKLDNRRDNLRLATDSQSAVNRVHPRNASGYRGVYRQGNRWRALIRTGKKNTHLGYHNSPVEAATAYDTAARERYGEFALVNFPYRQDEEV